MLNRARHVEVAAIKSGNNFRYVFNIRFPLISSIQNIGWYYSAVAKWKDLKGQKNLI